MNCGYCGNDVPDIYDITECLCCGAPVWRAKRCEYCGRGNSVNDKKCRGCGSGISSTTLFGYAMVTESAPGSEVAASEFFRNNSIDWKHSQDSDIVYVRKFCEGYQRAEDLMWQKMLTGEYYLDMPVVSFNP
jgi:RNA polymerase subunit RPABC4/transcription elongation factor Spt4